LNCDPHQEYASTIIFELHTEDDKKYNVRVRHDGKYVYLCGKKDITCDYTQFITFLSKKIVDVEQVCNRPE
jgi:hypothetical protein